MNYLAQFYLSEGKKRLIIGDFIANGIGEKKHKYYPDEIQIEISLHNEINAYTDKYYTQFQKIT